MELEPSGVIFCLATYPKMPKHSPHNTQPKHADSLTLFLYTHLTTLKNPNMLKHSHLAPSLTLKTTHTSQHSNPNTLKHSHLVLSLTLKTHTHLTVYTQTQTRLTSRCPLRVSNRSSLTLKTHTGLQTQIHSNLTGPVSHSSNPLSPLRHSDSSYSLFKPRANWVSNRSSLTLKTHTGLQTQIHSNLTGPVSHSSNPLSPSHHFDSPHSLFKPRAIAQPHHS